MTSYDAATFPVLWHFFGAYLHQDFEDEYGTEEGALEAYLEESQTTAGLVGEIEQLLASASTEAALQDACDRLGSCFYAPWDGGTYGGWLTQVVRRCKEWVDARSS